MESIGEVCTLNVEVMYNSCMNWAEPIPKHEDAGAKRGSPFTAETQRTQRKRREEQRERKDQDPAFAAEGAEIADGKTGREVLCPL